MTVATHNNLYDAVAYLAGRCDWAYTEDGEGFNKSDTGLGHFLAELPAAEWSDEQRYAAYLMLRKYKGQLAGGGIEYDAIPAPPRPKDYYGGEASEHWVRDAAQEQRRETVYARKAEEREEAEKAQRQVGLEGGRLWAKAPYNADIVEACKAVPGRRWDGTCNTFPTDAAAVAAVKAIVEEYGFTVSAEAQAILDGVAEAKAAPTHRIELDGEKWRYAGERPFVLCFPKDFSISGRIKKLNGWEWSAERVCWGVKSIAENVPELRAIADEHGFLWSKDARARLEELRGDADRMEREARELTEASKALDTDVVFEGVDRDLLGIVDGPLSLRGFQNAGVAYALRTRRCFIADDMGTGKTVQALIAAREAEAFPLVVVVRASIKSKWRDEAKRWLPGRKVVVLSGTKPDIQDVDGADVIVVNYDVLPAWAGMAGKDAVRRGSRQREADKPGLLCRIAPKGLVVDESHYGKTPEAKRTRALLMLARTIESDYGRDGLVLNLTGTPVLNRPIELAAQLAIVNRLAEFGGYWGYAKRYCNAGPWGYQGAMDVSGSSHEEELHAKLRATCFIRRTKDQVLTELPEKQIARLPVEITNAREYREAELNVINWVRDQVERDREFLAEIADLDADEQKRRIAARKTEKEIRARHAEELVKLNALRRITARGKLAAAKDWIEDFLESTATEGNGEKLVVFAHHRDIQAELAEAFPGCLRIHADDDMEERYRNMRTFQDDPSKRLIVCSMEAAREGLDLFAASNALFIEFGWNVMVHRQAEDRIHRMGQTAGSCTIWQMVGEGTIDEDMQSLIEAKRHVTEAVTDGKVSDEKVVAGSIATETLKRLKARHE